MTPTSPKDPINRAILEVSEDQIKGFKRNPIGEIAQRGLSLSPVHEVLLEESVPSARTIFRLNPAKHGEAARYLGN